MIRQRSVKGDLTYATGTPPQSAIKAGSLRASLWLRAPHSTDSKLTTGGDGFVSREIHFQ